MNVGFCVFFTGLLLLRESRKVTYNSTPACELILSRCSFLPKRWYTYHFFSILVCSQFLFVFKNTIGLNHRILIRCQNGRDNWLISFNSPRVWTTGIKFYAWGEWGMVLITSSHKAKNTFPCQTEITDEADELQLKIVYRFYVCDLRF